MQKNFCLLLICFFSFSANAQKKWTLQDCITYARTNNIAVRQADIQARMDQLTLVQSKLNQYPTVDFSNSGGMQFGRSIDPTSNQFTSNQIFFTNHGLNVGWNLFNWFKAKNTVAANNLNAQASNALVDKIRDDISLNIANGYLVALLNKQRIEVSKIQIAQSLSQYDATAAKVDAGTLPELNLLELKTQLATDSANYFDAVSSYQLSLLQLKAVLNMDAAEPFEIAAPPVSLIPVEPIAELAPDNVYQSALKFLPQQKINQLLTEAAKKRAQVAKAAMYPGIGIFGGVSTLYSNAQRKIPSSFGYSIDSVGFVRYNNQNLPVFVGSPSVTGYDKNTFFTQLNHNFSQNIGLSIRIPIFNGGSAKTQWKQALLSVENQKLVNEKDAQQLKQDIYQAHSNAVAALQKFNAGTVAVAIAQKTYDYAKKRYDVGLLSAIDLITNQNNLYNTKVNLLLAQFDYVFKMKLLEFYKGLGIKL